MATAMRETAIPENTMSGNDHSDTPTHLGDGVTGRELGTGVVLSCENVWGSGLGRSLG